MSFSKSPGCKKKININFPEIFVDTQLNKKSDTPFLHSILDKKPSMVMANKKCRKININFFFKTININSIEFIHIETININ